MQELVSTEEQLVRCGCALAVVEVQVPLPHTEVAGQRMGLRMDSPSQTEHHSCAGEYVDAGSRDLAVVLVPLCVTRTPDGSLFPWWVLQEQNKNEIDRG
jgi:hypothetical protein